MPQNTPAGTNDYVYPGMIEQREKAAIEVADQEARGDITNPIVRDILPELDFDETEATVWDGTVGWDQTPTDAPWEAGEYDVYEIDSDTGKSERRVHAIYGFEVIEGGEFVNVVRFKGSDGQVFERAEVEGLTEETDSPVDRQKTLRSPVKFGPQDNGIIAFELDEAAGEDSVVKIKLLGVTAEKLGRRVGERS